MITAALDAGVAADFVTGDEVYGINPDLRSLLEDRGLSYVLAISCTTPVMLGAGKSTAEHAIEQVPEHAWQTRSAGAGAKGLRLYDWALVDLVGAGDGHRSLLARRNRTTGEIAYHLTWTPAPVSLQTLVTVAGMRWRIEECFQARKSSPHSTNTRSGPGLPGTDGSPSPCSPTRSWPPPASAKPPKPKSMPT